MCEISVIVPVYNVEQYLPRCLDSILQQTFSDFEIILVEDGTEDGAGSICDDYSGRDERIRVIHQKNMGLAQARKNGLSIARGRYIMFVDSDDWIDSQMLETMYGQAEKTNADVVCAQCRRVDEKGRILSRKTQFKTVVCEESKEMAYHLHVTRRISTSACTKLISKEIMRSVIFKENLGIGEEHDMVAQIILYASKMVVTDEIFYNYFMRGNSISHAGYTEKYANSLDNYLAIEGKMERLFPDYRGEIRGFYAEFEMAVMTAMCRNKKFDWRVINRLRSVLGDQMADIIKNKGTPMYMKICIVMTVYVPYMFIILFRIIHLLTGR